MKKVQRVYRRSAELTYYARWRLGAWKWSYRRGVVRLLARVVGFKGTWTAATLALDRQERVMPVKPTVGSGKGAAANKVAPGGGWEKKYPLVLGFMTDQCWDDGSARVPCKLFTNVEAGRWTLTLKEPNLGVLLTVAEEDPELLLPALEALLAAPVIPWVADPYHRPVGKRRSK